MSKTTAAENFQPLELTQKTLDSGTLPKYRVFSDTKNFVLIEANNAKEALQLSGIADVYRIEYDSPASKTLI